MLCEVKTRVQTEKPNNGAGAGRAEPSKESLRVSRRLRRAEEKQSKDALKEKDLRTLDGVLGSLRRVAVEEKDVATGKECRAHECETAVSEEEGGVSERNVFKRELEKQDDGMFADKENDEYGSGREKTVEKIELEVKIGAKVSV